MEQKSEILNELKDRELVMTRLLNAPRELVWKVWTQQNHVKQWWGPKGFTNPVCEWNAHLGSLILVHMQAPDGIIYPMTGEFQEVFPPERLVFSSAALDQNGQPLFVILNTILFSEEGSKTKLTLVAKVSKITAEGAPYLSGMQEGWSQSLDKLESYLIKNSMPFVIERTYNAPLSLVWKAITNNEDMKQWYFDIKNFKPEPGFEFSFIGQGKDGEKYTHLCKVIEVEFERKISYSWSYEGFEGYSLVTFELFPEGDKTRLQLTHDGIESFPPYPAFAKENFTEGWTMLIGKLLKDFVEKLN